MKTVISCPEEHELLAVLTGESVGESVRAHLYDCSECNLRLERLRDEVSAIRVMRQNPLPLGLAPARDDRKAPSENGWPTPACQPLEQQPAATPTPVALSSSSRNDGPNRYQCEVEKDVAPAIGKYLVVGRFPKSGQAEVFRVVHPELRRDLVLKLAFRPIGEDGLSEVVADGQRLAELEHPNIVRVHDLDFYEGRPYLVMEYIRGRTLTQFAREEQITAQLAATLMAELASAVAFAHGRGVVHQDIKPANVIIDEAGRPRLIDFGLAWQHDAWSVTHSHSEGGTFAFMAPEQARFDLERIRPLSDVFAIGAVLYFLLSGSGPFAAESLEESWDRARHCKLDRMALRNSGVPRRLERICLKALASEPEQRYRSAARLEQALRGFLRLRPIKLAATAVGVLLTTVVGLMLISPRLVPRASVFASPSAVNPGTSAPLANARTPSRPAVLNIVHMARRGENAFDLRGNLGERSFSVQAGDDVTIQAELTVPAYAYLIAFRPDGVDEICDPEDMDAKPRKTTGPRYPPQFKSDRVYRLNDGSGLIAFALVMSKTPLPSYREWKNRYGTPAWREGLSATPGVVWLCDGQHLAALTVDGGLGERGSGARIRGGGAAVADLAAWLRAVPGIDGVLVKAFPVPTVAGP